jgi:hypothetical protein
MAVASTARRELGLRWHAASALLAFLSIAEVASADLAPPGAKEVSYSVGAPARDLVDSMEPRVLGDDREFVRVLRGALTRPDLSPADQADVLSLMLQKRSDTEKCSATSFHGHGQQGRPIRRCVKKGSPTPAEPRRRVGQLFAAAASTCPTSACASSWMRRRCSFPRKLSA